MTILTTLQPSSFYAPAGGNYFLITNNLNSNVFVGLLSSWPNVIPASYFDDVYWTDDENIYRYRQEYTYERGPDNTLIIRQDPTHHDTLHDNLIGEYGNVFEVAQSLKHKADRFLDLLAALSQPITPADSNYWLTDTQIYHKAAIVHLIKNCLPNEAKGILNRKPEEAKKLFHEIARAYNTVVYRGETNWDVFSSHDYGDNKTFHTPTMVDNFFEAVKAKCEEVGVDELTTPSSFINSIVYAVESNGYPSVAPTIEVDVVSAGGTLCDATAVTTNTTGDVSFHWYLNNLPIEGATGSLFDYAGHSGDLKVIATATDYIGGTVSAESSIIKIA